MTIPPEALVVNYAGSNMDAAGARKKGLSSDILSAKRPNDPATLREETKHENTATLEC